MTKNQKLKLWTWMVCCNPLTFQSVESCLRVVFVVTGWSGFHHCLLACSCCLWCFFPQAAIFTTRCCVAASSSGAATTSYAWTRLHQPVIQIGILKLLWPMSWLKDQQLTTPWRFS